MTRSINSPDFSGLKLLHSLCADHGDAFRLSLSKKGRLWLTLTHWDTEKYNTSVEMDPMADAVELLDLVAVLSVAHWAKCFRSEAHQDTWHGIDATRALVLECREQVTRILTPAGDTEEPPSPPAS